MGNNLYIYRYRTYTKHLPNVYFKTVQHIPNSLKIHQKRTVHEAFALKGTRSRLINTDDTPNSLRTYWKQAEHIRTSGWVRQAFALWAPVRDWVSFAGYIANNMGKRRVGTARFLHCAVASVASVPAVLLPFCWLTSTSFPTFWVFRKIKSKINFCFVQKWSIPFGYVWSFPCSFSKLPFLALGKFHGKPQTSFYFEIFVLLAYREVYLGASCHTNRLFIQ